MRLSWTHCLKIWNLVPLFFVSNIIYTKKPTSCNACDIYSRMAFRQSLTDLPVLWILELSSGIAALPLWHIFTMSFWSCLLRVLFCSFFLSFFFSFFFCTEIKLAALKIPAKHSNVLSFVFMCAEMYQLFYFYTRIRLRKTGVARAWTMCYSLCPLLWACSQKM